MKTLNDKEGYLLITGGAGYVGAHVARKVEELGKPVIVLDNFSAGKRQRLSSMQTLIEGDIRDSYLISSVFSQFNITGVVNCAALKSVPESIKHPELYNWVNNLAATLLLEEAIKKGCRFFIQSSTAAVYGSVVSAKVLEDVNLSPISPYGLSKLSFEERLNKSIKNGDISGVSLRFFNVAGSRSKNFQDSDGENLIPLVIKRILSGQEPIIFGRNHPTSDGTCIRDFVDVRDVAEAHSLALMKLFAGIKLSNAINIGTGRGYSVSEVVEEALHQLGSNLRPFFADARDGDAPTVVANVDRARIELGFLSEFELSEMISSSI